MDKNLEKEEYIKIFNEKLNKKYNGQFSLISGYENCQSMVTLKCNKCNTEFKYNANYILKKRCNYKCKNCKAKNVENQFKKEVYALVDDEYTVLGMEKIDSHTFFIMQHNCDKCNNFKFKTTKSRFLVAGNRCQKCAGLAKKNTLEFKKEIYELTNNEYEISGEYKNNCTPIKFKHKKCGNEFLMTPTHFTDGDRRCPFCNGSNVEKITNEILIKENIDYEWHYKNPLCKNIKELEFDFKINLENGDFILLELDGPFHSKCLINEETLNRQIHNDSIKNEFCKNNNIKLIRISYEKFNNIENEIYNILKTEKVQRLV